MKSLGTPAMTGSRSGPNGCTDLRSVGIIGPPRRDSPYMPIHSWLDAGRIPLRIRPAGGQTAYMRRVTAVRGFSAAKTGSGRLDTCAAVVTSQERHGFSANSSGLGLAGV